MNEHTDNPADATAPETTLAQEAESDADAEAAPPTARRRPWILILLLLLLLVGGGAGGAGYLTWKHVLQQFDELRGADAALKAEDSALSKRADALQKNVDQQLAGLDQHPALQNLAEFIETEKQKLATDKQALDETVDQQQQRIQGLQESLQVTHDIATRDQRGWALAEVRYLMHLGHYRLRLMRDLDGAGLALEAADQRLYEIGDPLLQPVREALAAEIYSLRHFKRADRTGVALKLHNLVTNLAPLPLRGASVEATAPQAPATEPTQAEVVARNGWEGLLSAVSQELHRHVTINRNEQPVEPLLDAETRLYSHQILRLRLEAARLAVLSEDEKEYHRQLQAASDWISAEFQPEPAAALLADLNALNEITIRPELPQINTSLIKLGELVQAGPAPEGS